MSVYEPEKRHHCHQFFTIIPGFGCYSPGCWTGRQIIRTSSHLPAITRQNYLRISVSCKNISAILPGFVEMFAKIDGSCGWPENFFTYSLQFQFSVTEKGLRRRSTSWYHWYHCSRESDSNRRPVDDEIEKPGMDKLSKIPNKPLKPVRYRQYSCDVFFSNYAVFDLISLRFSHNLFSIWS